MFYGWWIVAGVFITQMAMVGFYTYSFSLFVVPLELEFAASRTEIMAGMTGAGLVSIVLPPLLGPLVDKWSVRGLMSIGAAVLGTAFLLLSISPNILVFTALFAVMMAFAQVLLGPMTGSTVVSRWFARRRGLALGIAAMGTSIGGFVLPLLMAESIEVNGWRETLRYFGFFVLLVQLPYLLLVIRNYPADMALQPDGDSADAEAGPLSPGLELQWKTLLRDKRFWQLSISLGLLFCCYGAVMANLTAYAGDHGIASTAAARLISIVAVMGLIGKFIFGALADRLSQKLLLGVSIALTTCAIAILATMPQYSSMVLAAILMGLSAGGMLPVWGAIVPALFGLENYGRVMGLMMPVIAIFSMPGFVILARSFDLSGSYQTGLLVFFCLLLVSLTSLFFLRPPAKPA